MSSYKKPTSGKTLLNKSEHDFRENFVADDYFLRQESQSNSFQVWDPVKNNEENSVGNAPRDSDSFMPNSQDQNQITAQQEESLESLGEEYKKGFEAGNTAAEEKLRSQSEQVDTLLNALSEGHCDTMEFYNPLKILAVKIAEAVLKTDLEESKASIEKISQELIDSFSLLKDEAVRLFLSPEDLNKLSAEFKDRHSNVEFIADRKLSRGSSYAEMNDRLVTDFSEERLTKVIQQVLPHDKG